MISFVFQEYNLRYPLKRRVSGLQKWSENLQNAKITFPCQESKLSIVGCPVWSPVILFWLSSVCKINA
jgi:hypothetical protein